MNRDVFEIPVEVMDAIKNLPSNGVMHFNDYLTVGDDEVIIKVVKDENYNRLKYTVCMDSEGKEAMNYVDIVFSLHNSSENWLSGREVAFLNDVHVDELVKTLNDIRDDKVDVIAYLKGSAGHKETLSAAIQNYLACKSKNFSKGLE